MDKNIVTGGALDESIALCGIEPLHDTLFFHVHFSCHLFVVLLGLTDKESGLSRLAKNFRSRGQTTNFDLVGYFRR